MPDHAPKTCQVYRSIIAAVIAILAVLCTVGCPNPDVSLVMLDGAKKTRQITIKPMGDLITLSVSGISHLTLTHNSYRVLLCLDVQYSESAGELSLDPASIEVHFKDRQMALVAHRITSTPDTVLEGGHVVEVPYEFVPLLDSGETVDALDSTLKIVVDKFLSCDGNPVYIDTILAIEPKLRKNYLRRVYGR